ncbi:hypothetical protein CUJ84_Chr003211 [Rhizobium leguminosarum]|uniref:Uncharacterized protein n=1 Tax=Rhizobium leguminosarum TaxID=384 RepID=A0A2K9Z615_RHILE|nr:hypothetical protein CUJ84_Chr003211 [Rhizobium leguminosarum]
MRASSVASSRTAVVLPAPPLVFANVMTGMFGPRKEWCEPESLFYAPSEHRAVNSFFLIMVNKFERRAAKLQPVFFTSLKIGMPPERKRPGKPRFSRPVCWSALKSSEAIFE